MSRIWVWALTPLAVWMAGCGDEVAESCAGYVAAYNTCAQAAGAFTQDEAQVCAGADEGETNQYQCLTRAYQSDDCGTQVGLAAVNAEAQACIESN